MLARGNGSGERQKGTERVPSRSCQGRKGQEEFEEDWELRWRRLHWCLVSKKGKKVRGGIALKKVGKRSRRELGRLSAAASGGKGGRWAQEMMTILAGMS